MGFGDLSGSERLRVILDLKGAAEYVAQMAAASEASLKLARANRTASVESKQLTKNTWLQNQAMFTARRYAFYATLAVTGLALAVARLGFTYLSTMQTARVALQPLFAGPKELTAELNKLYNIAALSPFVFKDMTQAFRTMYPALHAVGFSAAFTNRTLTDMVDALSEAGRTTPQNLTRMSVQLQHLANIGRPTGQILLALARDGLPVYPALRKELGLTGTSLEQIARSGLTAKQVMVALNKYIEDNPVFHGAAFRQANKTLSGAWQTFKDMLSQAAGRAEGGLFGGLQKALFGINKQLAPLLENHKPITIYNIVDAIDRQLTPGTHIIMDLFQLITGTIQGLVFEFGALFKVIQIVLWPLGKLTGAGRANERVFRVLGYVTSVLVALWALGRVRAMKLALAEEVLAIKTFILKTNAKSLAIWTGITESAIWGWVTATYAEAGALGVLTAAIYAIPIVGWLLLLATVLVTLYWKWKFFHDAVNSLISTLWHNPLLAFFFPMIGPLVVIARVTYEIAKNLQDMVKWGKEAGHWVGNIAHKGEGLLGAASFLPGALPFVAAKHLFTGHATGGYTGSSPVWVGERGPELAQFPRGTRIIPNSQVSAATSGGGVMPTLHVTVTPQAIYFDKKKVGEVMSTVKTDATARA